MKVSKEFFQFPEPSLIVAVDSQTARFFFVFQGLLTELPKVRSKPAPQKDRPTLQRTSGHGRVFHQGASSSEPNKEPALAALFRDANVALKQQATKHKVERLYLFAAAQLLPRFQSSLPHDLAALVRLALPADVVHEHPKDVIERITEELPR